MAFPRIKCGSAGGTRSEQQDPPAALHTSVVLGQAPGIHESLQRKMQWCECWSTQYHCPALRPARRCAADSATMRSNEIRIVIRCECHVKGSVVDPDFTFRGKLGKVGVAVATIAVPVSGVAVQQWMCAMVVFAVRPLKL